MNLRVASQSQVSSTIAYLRDQQAGLAMYSDQISSGTRVKLPSDNPGQYPALAGAKATSARLGVYADTMSAATTTLNASVSAFQEVNSVLTQAKQLATEGASADTDQQGADALATQVDSLIGRLMTAGNTQVNGQYIFGGTATNTPPFSVATTTADGKPATIAYDGSADRGRALIGPNGQTVDTQYAGNQVFQKSGADAFQALIGLRDALRDPTLSGTAKSAALNTQLGALDAAFNAVGDAMGEQSSSLASLDALQNRMQDLKLTADTRASDIETTDYAEAAVKMQQMQNSLQATMAVSSQMFQSSFLDFIK